MINIQSIDRHSFISDIVSSTGYILDVGCRGFGFSNHFVNLGLIAIALDPDKDIMHPENDRIKYEQVALTHDISCKQLFYETWSTGEGNYTHTDGDISPNYSNQYVVPALTISDLMTKYGVAQFEILKLDCEGAEYDILMAIEQPVAKQLTIEFHDFLGKNPYPNRDDYYAQLFEKLSPWYSVVQHNWGPMTDGGCQVPNYWDSLLVLKDLL